MCLKWLQAELPLTNRLITVKIKQLGKRKKVVHLYTKVPEHGNGVDREVELTSKDRSGVRGG